MPLDQQINDAFLTAYKNKEELVVSVLRMIKTAIANKKTEKLMPKDQLLADEEVLAILKSEVKKRNDSILAYRQGGRDDLAVKEEQEIALIDKFLPPALTEEQVRGLVTAAIDELGNPGPTGFGKVMSAVMASAKGAADGQLVSKLVKEELGK